MDSNKKDSFFSAMLVSLLAFCLCFTSCGPSAAEIARREREIAAIRSIPSVQEVKGLGDKLIWLYGNAQSGGNYILEIDADEKVIGGKGLSYENKSNITITIKGIGANRTIHLSSILDGSTVSPGGFIVGSGVTLILDDNITLKGGANFSALVLVGNGGTLVMNDGSTITGNTNIFNNPGLSKVSGAGVGVSDGGTFIMKGGTISGNTLHPERFTPSQVTGATFACIAAGGGLKCNGVRKAYEVVAVGFGGGVYVSAGATFTKTGGTITGYADDPENGNVVIDIKDDKDKPSSNHGHAIYFDGREPKSIDTTVGPEYNFNFSKGTFKETSESDVKDSAEIQKSGGNSSAAPTGSSYYCRIDNAAYPNGYYCQDISPTIKAYQQQIQAYQQAAQQYPQNAQAYQQAIQTLQQYITNPSLICSKSGSTFTQSCP